MRRRLSLEEEPLEEPLVNLTPLIDVVFVVLISFMLIAPILDIDKIDLAIGGEEKHKNSLPPESAPLSILVRADNSIWMQGKQLPSLKDLGEKLRNQKKLHPEKTPLLIQDRNATFGTYQSIKNTVEQSGFAQLDVILKPNS